MRYEKTIYGMRIHEFPQKINKTFANIVGKKESLGRTGYATVLFCLTRVFKKLKEILWNTEQGPRRSQFKTSVGQKRFKKIRFFHDNVTHDNRTREISNAFECVLVHFAVEPRPWLLPVSWPETQFFDNDSKPEAGGSRLVKWPGGSFLHRWNW